MLMIDLYSGLGGASQPMKDRGWEVIRVDINPAFNPDLCIDVRDFLKYWDGRSPDLLWASPPCDDFSKSEKPWYDFCPPSQEALELVKVVFDIVLAIKPKFWILENVRGAQKWLGKAPFHCGSFYLWGYFPFEKLNVPHSLCRKPFFKDVREVFSVKPEVRKAMRSKIPYELALAIALIVENELKKEKNLPKSGSMPLFEKKV